MVILIYLFGDHDAERVDAGLPQGPANWFDQGTGYNNYFNPTDGKIITLNGNGNASIFLGGNPSVGSDVIPDDVYLGYGIVFVEYIGTSL